MRKDPDRYGALIYHNRSSIRQSRDYNSNHYYDTASYGQQQQYQSQDYISMLIEEAEKLYTSLIKEWVDKIIMDYASHISLSLRCYHNLTVKNNNNQVLLQSPPEGE